MDLILGFTNLRMGCSYYSSSGCHISFERRSSFFKAAPPHPSNPNTSLYRPSFSSLTLFQKSLDKPVLTVPGCILILIAFSPALARNPLSVMLPTRALMVAQVARSGSPSVLTSSVDLRGRKGEKCLSSIIGPSVLVRKREVEVGFLLGEEVGRF
ncbi:hypothetical protein KC321_g28 [Hortaea werneckii]|nr:hypothetical protein KC321_g28 [Hortaea werneckii]